MIKNFTQADLLKIEIIKILQKEPNFTASFNQLRQKLGNPHPDPLHAAINFLILLHLVKKTYQYHGKRKSQMITLEANGGFPRTFQLSNLEKTGEKE